MNRKTLLTRAAAALLLGTVAAALPAQAQGQKKITLLTWNLPVYGEKIAAWTKEFNQKYPDIQVEWIDKKGTEWATFYQAQLAAGTAPDVVNIQGTLWAEYALDDRLLDLTPYLAKDAALKARFAPGALDIWSANGKNWLLPWYFSKTLLFGNKALMKASGIDAMPRSFDELMAASAKVKGPGKSGFLTTNFDWLYWPLFKMNGVDVLNPTLTKAAFNTAAGAATLAKLSEATRNGVINNISWTGRWVEPNTAFASGNVAMYLAPTSALFWAASKADWIDEKGVEVVELAGLYAVPNNHGFGVSKSSKYPDAAVELIKIATSDKWQKVFAENFSVATLNTAVDKALLEKMRDENPLKAKALELTTRNLDKMTGYLKTPKDARVKDIFWTEVQPVLLGKGDAAAALAKAQERIDRELARP
ncbi:MAG: extracellular solute-binding protein [Proteobacteria bacterium]|nr:extracellular solute-binding protein [Pseudomonadota bacterium]